MLALVLFALVGIASVRGNCDGEVLTCEECTALSETFTKCDWCPSNGKCHGDTDIFTGGCEAGWLDTCEPPAPECDGETHRSCEECTALSERFTKCDYCAADGRCHGDTDIVSCSSGWQDTCEPPAETNCDGEVIGCEQCLQKAEGFFLNFECKWCSSDRKCHGTKDFFPACDGEWIGAGDEDLCPATPTPAPTPEEADKFPCKQCTDGCVAECTLERLDNLHYCARGGTTGFIVESAATCFANADSSSCCATIGGSTGGSTGATGSTNGQTGGETGGSSNGQTGGNDQQVVDSDLVSMCACGEGSCEDTCVNHRIGECEPFSTLCDEKPTGYVRVVSENQAHTATFHGAADCSDAPTASLSNACGSCNEDLRMQFKCASGAANLVMSAALALSALFVIVM